MALSVWVVSSSIIGEQKANTEVYSGRGRRAGIIGPAAVRRKDLLRVQGSSAATSSQRRATLPALRRCEHEASIPTVQLQTRLVL